MRLLYPATALLLVASCALNVGCDKKADPAPTPAAPSSKAASKSDDTAKATTTAAAEKPAAKVDDYKGPVPSNDKEFLGLALAPQGKWKPTWDADAKVAKWESDDSMTGIVIRIVDDKLDTIDDLKAAAPMMMQLGSDITKVVEQKTTPKGWYAVVERDKETDLVYVRKFGATTVCQASLTKGTGSEITKDDAIKACESYSPK